MPTFYKLGWSKEVACSWYRLISLSRPIKPCAIFFREDLHAQSIRLFDACVAACLRAGMNAQAVAAEIFQPRHRICGQLPALQKLEVVRLIEGSD